MVLVSWMEYKQINALCIDLSLKKLNTIYLKFPLKKQ